MQLLKHCVIFLRTGTKRTRNVSIGHGCPRYMHWLCFNKRPITPSKISGSVFWYYISTYQIWIKSMQSFKSYWADTKFRTDGRTNGRTNARTHARTGVTLNAPPPFFEWRGHKHQNKSNLTPNIKRSADTKALFLYCDSLIFLSSAVKTSKMCKLHSQKHTWICTSSIPNIIYRRCRVKSS